jgi:hypothetical protein
LSQEPDETLSLPGTSPGPGFPGQQVSAFFFSSHHITWVSSRLFLRALARWSVDPIQPAGQRALIGSSYPTLSGRGFRGVVAELGRKGKGGLDAGVQLGLGGFSSFPSRASSKSEATYPSLFVSLIFLFFLFLRAHLDLTPSFPALAAAVACPD